MDHQFLKNSKDAASYNEDIAFELLERRIEARKVKTTTEKKDHVEQQSAQARTCAKPVI